VDASYPHLLQQIPNKPTTRFFVKAPLCGAFTKNLGLVCLGFAVSSGEWQEWQQPS